MDGADRRAAVAPDTAAGAGAGADPGAGPGAAAAWPGALRGWRRAGLALLAGVLFAAGHAPIGLPWTAFVAVPCLALLVAGTEGMGAAARIGWCFGFGYLVVSLHWVGHAFLVEAEAYAWLLPFAVTLLPAGLALFWAVAAAVARAGPGAAPAGTALRLAGALTLTEWLRGWVLTGLPWALPGYVWAETPLAQAAAYVGPHGLGLLTLALTGLAGTLALAPRQRWRAGLALLAFAALWIGGAAREAAAPVPEQEAGLGADPVVRIVQPNAAQHLKWTPEHAPRFFARALDLSAGPADPALGPADMVVWPETAVAFLPEDQPAATARMAEAAGAPLVFGAIARSGQGYANALMVLERDGRIAARYDKAHLVPFGEYMPFSGLFAAVGLDQLAGRGAFVPGPRATAVTAAGLPSFVPLICYEAIFPAEVAAAVAGADANANAGAGAGAHTAARPRLLLQITNDAWFGTLGGPQQHLVQARLRAIEQGLPMVRAANTGISAMIDAHGRVVAALPLGMHGALDAVLPPRAAAPPYADLGDGMAILSAVLLFFASFVRLSRH
ncbi:MAG: apolipoprotein N-acyltransferase [Pseudomonadota bacterium]